MLVTCSLLRNSLNFLCSFHGKLARTFSYRALQKKREIQKRKTANPNGGFVISYILIFSNNDENLLQIFELTLNQMRSDRYSGIIWRDVWEQSHFHFKIGVAKERKFV